KRIVRDALASPGAIELIRIPWGDHDEQDRVERGDARGFLTYLVESRGFAKYPESFGRTIDSFVDYAKEEPLEGRGSCFVPHHGIIARAGSHRIEMLVCFMCAHAEIHVDGFDGQLEYALRESSTEHNPSRAFSHVLDALFDQSGVPPAVPGRAGPPKD